MAAPPEWTTVPTQDDSGWRLYRPAATHPAAPTPQPAQPAQTRAQPRPAATVRRTVPTHRKHARSTSIPVVVVRPQPTGAVLAATPGKGAPGDVSAVVLAALLAATVCLAFASVPTTHIRWRRGAAFVAGYRTTITSMGAALLLAAAIAFVLGRS